MKNGRFLNSEKSAHPSLLKVLRWKLMSPAKPWPKQVVNTHRPELPSQVESFEALAVLANVTGIIRDLVERGIDFLREEHFQVTNAIGLKQANRSSRECREC